MRLLIFGTGVIGCTVGSQLLGRNDITHFVRSARLDALRAEGIAMACTDMRKRRDRTSEFLYRPGFTDSLDSIGDYDACLIAVRSDQLPAVLDEHREALQKISLFIMQNVGLDDYGALSRDFGDKVFFAYPFIMGGGRNGNRIECAIFNGAMNHMVLGRLGGERRDIEKRLFAELKACGLRPAFSPDIAAYLKLHYVWATCVLGSYMKSGSYEAFIERKEIGDSYRAMVECFARFRKDGIDSRKLFPYCLYHLPPFLLAAFSRGLYRTDAMRTMLEGHIRSSPDEMKAMFDAVSAYCGDNAAGMKVFGSYQAAAEAYFRSSR